MLIPLTRNQFSIVDDADYEFLNQWKWQAAWTRFGQFYATRTDCSQKPFKVVRIHRLLMPDHPEMDIDHINGNPLDNRRENLRYATRSQNCMNRRVSAGTKSGHKGITWEEKSKSWRIRIMIGRQSKSLGYAKSLEEAISIRREAEIQYCGEFRCENR